MIIDYRAYFDSYERMIYAIGVIPNEGKIIVNFNQDIQDRYQEILYVTDKIHLMQYTGILDKHNQRIYEKDYIMNTQTKEIYKVVWNGSHAAFEMVSVNDKRKSLFFANQSFKRFEIVGNVYENPEIKER